jgi:hypothetical protein
MSALTAGQIIAIATEAAHCPNKQAQAQLLLNAILSDLAQERDFALARRQFVFTFAPGVISSGLLPATPPSSFGSGPYQLPLDYLRMSGSSGSSGSQKSFIWWLNGVPYPVIPVDLAEFDLQVQQPGLNSYVWLEATDMSSPISDRIQQATTGDVTANSTAVANIANMVRLAPGLGVAGQGIVPGTTLLSVNTGTQSAVLSQSAILTIPQASLIFGYAPTTWVYPPPSSAQQASIRYQALMPPITDFTTYPWFPNDGYLIEKLTGRLCQLVDDDRAPQLLGGPDVPGSPDQKLSAYLAAKDDDANRPKRVELDRRTFGQAWPSLPSTKTIGW